MHTLFHSRGRAWTAAAVAAALTLIAGASAGVNTPHSGWYSGNPTLGPNNLTDLVCGGSTCYAAGAFGTLLKSTNAGSTWSGVVTGLTLDLRRVRMAGSPDRLVVGAGCALRRSDDGGATFQRLPFSASDLSCPSPVGAFSFPSSSVGYLVLTNNSVLSTADGGQTFTRRTAVPVIPPATDLLCTSDTTCFASSGGSIQRTTDGAVTWTQVAGFSLPLFGLEQADATTLYAVGQTLQLLKSTDGGTTWEQKAVAGVPAGDFGSIRCSDADNCLLAMRQGNRIVKTADGGDTFTAATPPAESAFAVELASATRGLAVGNVGSAVISDDGGDTWRVVGGRLTDDFTVLEGATDRIAYAGGRAGALARTTDAGQTWANVSPPTSLGVRAVAAPTAARLFVLADDGTVQRSDNGGASYRLLNTGTPVGARDLVATDANHVVVIGTRGIRRSIDGGETFSAVSDRDLRGAGLLMADTAGSGIVAAGRLRLLFSPNGGLTWRPLRRPTKSRIHDISFVSTQTGYLVDLSFRLWKTTNAGRTWTELVSTGRPMTQVDFADSRNGYVVVPRVGLEARGFVLRTSDGGASWRPQLVSPAFVRDVDMAGGTAYALAGTNFLYATTSGGDVGTARALLITTRGRRISKPTTITVSGRLSSAVAGEQAVVSMRVSGLWRSQVATVASNGTFVTRWRVSKKSVFVGHALGTADHVGVGTKPLVVDVRPPKKKR
jgi:photosystem II stability/assembly factor-like uncharacterized protein